MCVKSAAKEYIKKFVEYYEPCRLVQEAGYIPCRRRRTRRVSAFQNGNKGSVFGTENESRVKMADSLKMER